MNSITKTICNFFYTLHIKAILLFIFVFICYRGNAQINYLSLQDAAIEFSASKENKKKIAACFYLADEYMTLRRYDSAQFWLNNIYSVGKISNNLLLQYLVTTRQSEVYYYNNLSQLGIRTANKSIQIATQLNDSALILDAYNFYGLFNILEKNYSVAKNSFLAGIKFLNHTKTVNDSLDLTKPQHIYGNLAETYFLIGNADSSLKYGFLSLQEASKNNSERGIAIANHLVGNAYSLLNNYIKAATYHTQAKDKASMSNQWDVYVIGQSGLAIAVLKQGKRTEAIGIINQTLQTIKEKNIVNNLFLKEFLREALYVSDAVNNLPNQVEIFSLLSKVEEARNEMNAQQMQSIINYATDSENKILNEQLLNLEEKQKAVKNRTAFLIVFAIALALFALFIIYFLKQKLRIANVRNNISRDLHDSVGAMLSGVILYSDLALKMIKKNKDGVDKIEEVLQKLNANSKQASEEMADIVWAIKISDVEGNELANKITNYCSELLAPLNINYNIDVFILDEIIMTDLKAKKNVLLIFKECINNIAKHSKASQVQIFCKKYIKHYIIEINDNGVGFDVANAKKSNGLKNLYTRCKDLKSTIEITANNTGSNIKVTIPLKSLKN